MKFVPTPEGDPQSHCAMTDVAPASASLQGIPPELRNKIYYYLALTTPRNVSGSKLVELRRFPQGSNLWKQFQLATATHPLTLTCRQMRTEFRSVLTTTPGQTYCLIVDSCDRDQFELFCEFIATYCFSHRISDKNFPPFLFHEVVLCMELHDHILASFEVNGWAERVQLRCDCGVIKGDFSEVTTLPGSSSSIYDDSTSKGNSTSKAQAKDARETLRRISDAYERYEPDQRVRRLLITHQHETLDDHWLSRYERARALKAYFAAQRNAE